MGDDGQGGRLAQAVRRPCVLERQASAQREQKLDNQDDSNRDLSPCPILVQLEYHSSPAIRGLSRVDHTGHKNREAAPANVIGESLPAGSEGPWKIQVFNQPGGYTK